MTMFFASQCFSFKIDNAYILIYFYRITKKCRSNKYQVTEHDVVWMYYIFQVGAKT